MKTATDLLRDLIAIPSVNPAFLPASDARAGEKELARFLGELAKRSGLEAEEQEVFPGRANLLVRWGPAGKVRRRILLAPHMDTVGVPDAGPDLLRPRIEGDRMIGRGACDTKGSIAAMLTAMLGLAESRAARTGGTEVLLTAFIDEEHQQNGSRSYIQQGGRGDLAIVGEPTTLAVATAHKGAVWLQLETRGRAAHGARPHLGRNAVHAMARVVDLLETRYARSLRQRRHPLLGSPTINVGSIQGGSQPNIVPPECRASIDRRTLPGETSKLVVKELKTCLKKARLAADFLPLQAVECLPMETDPKIGLVRQFLVQAGRKKPVGVHYFSDASILCQGGIPSVLFGPGNIDQAHTADEWVSVKQVEAASRMLHRFLVSIG